LYIFFFFFKQQKQKFPKVSEASDLNSSWGIFLDKISSAVILVETPATPLAFPLEQCLGCCGFVPSAVQGVKQ